MTSLFRLLTGFCSLVVLTACVTINISFPPAAAEKAADKIIDEVWQLKDGQKVPSAKPVPAQSQ